MEHGAGAPDGPIAGRPAAHRRLGGILRPEDALEKLDAGATLVQLYTGLIYAGPGLVERVVEATNR